MNMDTSGEVADLMVKESIQVTEAGIKLLAAGSKNLAAFLWALAKDGKKVAGLTSMAQLYRSGRPTALFRIKESDLKEFRAFAKKNVLFAVLKYKGAKDGTVDLITNVDYAAQVNLFMERKGYPVPEKEAAPPKKDGPRAPQGYSSPQRGSGLTASRTRPTKQMTRTTEERLEKPSVREKLTACQAEAEQRAARTAPQRARPTKAKTRS